MRQAKVGGCPGRSAKNQWKKLAKFKSEARNPGERDRRGRRPRRLAEDLSCARITLNGERCLALGWSAGRRPERPGRSRSPITAESFRLRTEAPFFHHFVEQFSRGPLLPVWQPLCIAQTHKVPRRGLCPVAGHARLVVRAGTGPATCASRHEIRSRASRPVSKDAGVCRRLGISRWRPDDQF